MTKKSNFKLDTRIKSMDDIQTCLEYDDKFINEKGYFFDKFCDTKDLSKCAYGKLVDIETDVANDFWFTGRICAEVRYTNHYRFFIPESLLKPVEKKYRPFTLNEFLVTFPMLTDITMREKGDNDCIITCTVTAYRTRIVSADICLGVEWISLKELFDKCEYKNTLGDWIPFGEKIEE